MRGATLAQITQDEARHELVEHLIGVVNFWTNETRAKTDEERCSGTVFSSLVALDGGAGVPGYELIDRQTCEDFGGALHEHIGHYIRGNPVCEGARHNFLTLMAEVSKRHVENPVATSEQKCRETLLDFLLILDGKSDFPRPRIVPLSNEDDIEYLQDEGRDWYPIGEDTYDVGGDLADLTITLMEKLP